MAIKTARFKIKGMNQDLAVSSFSPEFAYENFNLRVTATDNNTLLSLTNEKGNKLLNSTTSAPFGFTLGYAVIGDNLVLFTHEDLKPTPEHPNIDHIYRIYGISNTAYSVQELYSGILNFDMTHPIETLAWYENEEIQKVYWVDGLNKPRMINIIHNGAYSIVTSPETQFDFNRTLQLKEEINVTMETYGQFHSGTVQYFITYYDKNGTESNIAWQSQIFYISHKDRGASPDENVSRSFNLIFTDNTVDTNFEYLRIYAVQRTTKDGQVSVRKVADLSTSYIASQSNFTFTDNGIVGESVDATYLYYVGGANIIAGCITQKDQTLFLGDITLNIPKVTLNTFPTAANIGYIGCVWKPQGGLSYTNASGSLQANLADKYYEYYNQIGKDLSVIGGTWKHASEASNFGITSFKFQEYYRFGLQFQYENGEWSDVIYVGDKMNDVKVVSGYNGRQSYVLPQKTLATISFYTNGLDSRYKKVRPVVVYPSFYDRRVVCQGILCPTVYNVGDRVGGRTYSYSSWFSRPMAANVLGIPNNDAKRMTKQLNGNNIDQDYSRRGCWTEFRHNHGIPGPQKFNGEIQVQYWDWGGMINPTIPFEWYERNDTTKPHMTLDTPQKFSEKFSNGFNVDQSIFTMHSPDIEFDDNIDNVDLSDAKIRIIGYVPVHANSGDIDIQASAIGNYRGYAAHVNGNEEITEDYYVEGATYPSGFYKEKVGETTVLSGTSGWYSLINGPYWQDKIYNVELKYRNGAGHTGNTRWLYCVPEYTKFGFVTYPWQQTGSLSNDEKNEHSVLQTKIISNLKYSYDTVYFSPASPTYAGGFWNSSYGEGMGAFLDYSPITMLYSTGLSDIKVVKDNVIKMLNNPLGQDRSKITYSPMMDKIITVDNGGFNPKAILGRVRNGEYYGGTNVFAQDFDYPTDMSPYISIAIFPNAGGTIPTSVKFTAQEYFRPTGVFNNWKGIDYYTTLPEYFMDGSTSTTHMDMTTKVQLQTGISMRYKSSPHIVIAMGGAKIGSNLFERFLPVNMQGKETSYGIGAVGQLIMNDLSSGTKQFYFDSKYDDSTKRVKGSISSYITQADFGTSYDNNQEKHGFYWLAELYRDNVTNRFGGNTEEALANNVWYVAGEAVEITPNDWMTVICYAGDTFYQRYDHLKTYPYSQDDENQVIEIVSFMCESRVNIDGRYDLMRGLESNNNISPEAFNSINKVYSQLDNYITGSYIKSTDQRVTRFPNTVIWSDQKLNGEYVDKWTQILTTNSLDLDGDKGRLRALKEYAGTLWGFQDKAIAEILFNPNVAISTTDGSPIELASSGKVEGKRYKFKNVGCSNKWSICDTPVGLFFNDDINKNLMVLQDSPINISDKFGMSTWAKNNLTNRFDWDDEEWNNMTVQYDKKNKDVLYITSEQCLAYSTLLGTFTSFYSYENTPYFANIGDYTLALKRAVLGGYDYTYLWAQNLGTYGDFFGERQPFYTTIIVNDNPTVDKIFNTLEYRADYFKVNGDYDEDKTFTRVMTWNEYQTNGISGTLVAPNVQKKFRIWRMELPRDIKNPLDRMRNPWQYIKIQQDAAWGGKVQIHDFAVHYTE